MARSAQFHISCLGELLDEIRYAPRERKRQHMAAAERLLGEIEGGRTYPEDFVIFRITGYRPDLDEPTMVVGEALLRDLGVLIERLSGMIDLTIDECLPRRVISVEEALERLGVSRSTLHRYRKIGLVAHYVVGEDGKRRLSFFEDAVDRFAERHLELVGYAKSYDHLDEAQRVELLRLALQYYQEEGLGERGTVKRLAKEFGRTTESVRLLIKRHDLRHGERAIFALKRILDERSRSMILRAADFGIPMRDIAKRYERSRPALYRVIHGERLARLRRFVFQYIELPTFIMEDAEEVLLGSDAVTKGYAGGLSFSGKVDEWVVAVKTGGCEVDHDIETRWFGARHFLLYQVDRARVLIDRNHPSSAEVDWCETRLRWAIRLKERLLRSHLQEILATLEINLHQELVAVPAHLIRRLHSLALLSTYRSVDQFDPTRGQAFASLLRLNLDRAIARSGLVSEWVEGGTRRVAKRKAHGAGSMVELDDPYPQVDPWQGVFDLSQARVVFARDVLDGEAMSILEMRYGLGDERPMTCVEVGERLGMKAEQVSAVEYRARRRLRMDGFKKRKRTVNGRE